MWQSDDDKRVRLFAQLSRARALAGTLLCGRDDSFDSTVHVDSSELTTAPADDWNPIPYYLQQFVDEIACGNPEATSFYYQNWTIDYNEITNGTTRRSDPDFVRPSIAEVDQRIRSGSGDPDPAAADLIEYRGVKWERIVAAINRPNLVFVPANYALAELMRDIEAGNAPGFEALQGTNGLTADGELAWVD